MADAILKGTDSNQVAVDEVKEASSCCSAEVNDEMESDETIVEDQQKSASALDMMNQMNMMNGVTEGTTETEQPPLAEKTTENTEKKGITIGKGLPESLEKSQEREALKQAELLVEANKLAGLIGKGTFEDLQSKGQRGEKAIETIKKAFQESSDPKALAAALNRMLKLEDSPYSVSYEPYRLGGASLALERSLGKDQWGTESRERSEIQIPGQDNSPFNRFHPLPVLYDRAK